MWLGGRVRKFLWHDGFAKRPLVSTRRVLQVQIFARFYTSSRGVLAKSYTGENSNADLYQSNEILYLTL